MGLSKTHGRRVTCLLKTRSSRCGAAAPLIGRALSTSFLATLLSFEWAVLRLFRWSRVVTGMSALPVPRTPTSMPAPPITRTCLQRPCSRPAPSAQPEPVEAPAPRPRSSIADLPARGRARGPTPSLPAPAVAPSSTQRPARIPLSLSAQPSSHGELQRVKLLWFGRTLTQYFVTLPRTKRRAELLVFLWRRTRWRSRLGAPPPSSLPTLKRC